MSLFMQRRFKTIYWYSVIRHPEMDKIDYYSVQRARAFSALSATDLAHSSPIKTYIGYRDYNMNLVTLERLIDKAPQTRIWALTNL